MDTWLILAAIAFLLFCLIATVVALIVYSGAFEGVDVGAGKPPIGKVVIAYKFMRGPYQDCAPLFTEAYSIAPKNKGLGIFYDDPKKVEAHRLRYAIASILAEDDQEVDEAQKKHFEAEDFKIIELPRVDNVVYSSFPYKSLLSVFVAVRKVYPRMAEYIEDHKLCAYPFLEVYEGNVIRYMAPLSKQDEFFVPEALQRFSGEEPYESIYSDVSTQDNSQSDLSASADDSQSEPSLLDSPQVVRAAYFDKDDDKAGKGSGDEKDGQAGKESDNQDEKEGDSVSASAGEKVQGSQGSDEDSTSSFEDLKMDAAAMKDAVLP